VRLAYWIHFVVQSLAVGSVIFYFAHLEQRFRLELGGAPLPSIVVCAFRYQYGLWLFPVAAFLFAASASRSSSASAGLFAAYSAASLLGLVALAALAMFVSVTPFIYPISPMNR
jgi:hypothetical protein